MKVKNLTNPGAEPAHGDMVEVTLGSGVVITKQHFIPEPATPEREKITLSAFYRRMDITDHAAIIAEAKTDPVMQAWIDRLKAAGQEGLLDMEHDDMQLHGKAKLGSMANFNATKLDKLFK